MDRLLAQQLREIDALPTRAATLQEMADALDMGLRDSNTVDLFFDYMYCDITSATEMARELERANKRVAMLLLALKQVYTELDLAVTTGNVVSTFQTANSVVARGRKQGFII